MSTSHQELQGRLIDQTEELIRETIEKFDALPLGTAEYRDALNQLIDEARVAIRASEETD